MPSAKNISAPRSVKRAKAKEKIFDAAMELLEEYGYEYITVANVCEMAGISTGNFYHYFESKDELLANFFSVAYEKSRTAGEPTQTGDPFSDAVAPFVRYAQFCQDQGLQFVRNFYNPSNSSLASSDAPASEDTPFALPAMQEARQVLEEAKNAELLVPGANPVQITEDLCVAEKGCVFEWCVSGARFDLPALVQRLLAQHLSSYRA